MSSALLNPSFMTSSDIHLWDWNEIKQDYGLCHSIQSHPHHPSLMTSRGTCQVSFNEASWASLCEKDVTRVSTSARMAKILPHYWMPWQETQPPLFFWLVEAITVQFYCREFHITQIKVVWVPNSQWLCKICVNTLKHVKLRYWFPNLC